MHELPGISVFMIAHSRTYNLEHQLNCFVAQDYAGRAKYYLWLNNPAVADFVRGIVNKFRNALDIQMILSERNYYCLPRLAAAHLCSGPLIMMCDDDVIPAPHYLSTFQEAQLRLGAASAVCARGHVFDPDPNPAIDLAWESNPACRFLDEDADEQDVDFAHADNLMIPSELLSRIGGYLMPKREWMIVDDYWISYVLSHKLGGRIRKIRADGAFNFTPCADDLKIAMYHQPAVRKCRSEFYLYHRDQGWPGRNHSPATRPAEAAPAGRTDA